MSKFFYISPDADVSPEDFGVFGAVEKIDDGQYEVVVDKRKLSQKHRKKFHSKRLQYSPDQSELQQYIHFSGPENVVVTGNLHSRKQRYVLVTDPSGSQVLMLQRWGMNSDQVANHLLKTVLRNPKLYREENDDEIQRWAETGCSDSEVRFTFH